MRVLPGKIVSVGLLLLTLLTGCHDDLHDSDFYDDSLLPQKEEYTNANLGTKAEADEIAGAYNSWVQMVYYDKARENKVLYFTGGRDTINLTANSNGSVHFSLNRFHTVIMPLKLNVDIDVTLVAKEDTIFLNGADGSVRTTDDGAEIGLELPESDDATIEGYYLRSSHKYSLLLDPMLPIPIKLDINGILLDFIETAQDSTYIN